MNTIWQQVQHFVDKKFKKKGKTDIENWDFIMVFQQRYKDELQKYFERYVGNQNMTSNKYKLILNEKEQQVLVLLAISEQNMKIQATQLKILKKKDKKSFQFSLKDLNKNIYIAEEQKNTALGNYLKWIRARQLPQNKKIKQQERYSAYNIDKHDQFIKNQDGSIFTHQQQLRAKYNYLINYSIQRQGVSIHQQAKIYPLIDIMKHAGFIQLIPIHKRSKYGPIILGSLRSYVGANPQSYFAFVKFLQRWLVLPAIIGLITSFFNYSFQYTADDSPGDFIYAFIIMLWSIIFITKWENKQKWTQACEQSGYNNDWSLHQNMIDFQGAKHRQSRIHGGRQSYIPLLQRIWRYFVSISSCFTLLIATLYFMVISLNARGFVDQNHKILYFQNISNWAKQGGIFDSNTIWAQIPNIVHILVTNIVDESIYRPLAKKTTKYEQHFDNKSYQNSIISKYFVYQFIITFADMFYIAFIRLDIVGLRQQLLSLFFIDIVRRLIAQFLIPKIKARVRKYFVKNQQLKEDQENLQLAQLAILETNKEDYEPFDDYLEIVTNFGYLVMISSCFPLAPALIFIAHGIEALQDKYKIVHIFKRKLPSKYCGMGYWNKIIIFICYFSIITNIMLFSFSSKQITQFFPSLYEYGHNLVVGNTEWTAILQNAAQNVMENIVTTTTQILNPLIGTTPTQSPYDLFTPDVPLVQSFMPPAPQHQVQFISIIFIIEHVFLIIFLAIRQIITNLKCQADILIERRKVKRSIKKYLNKAAINDMVQKTFITFIGNILAKQDTKSSEKHRQKDLDTSQTNQSSFLGLQSTRQKTE